MQPMFLSLAIVKAILLGEGNKELERHFSRDVTYTKRIPRPAQKEKVGENEIAEFYTKKVRKNKT